MKQRYSLSSIFILIALMLFFGGCKKQRAWKIGLMLPMSGDFADFGLRASQGAQLAIREFEEQYGQIGDKDIQLVIKDSRFQSEFAAIAAKEFLGKENINALIGPMSSSSALAVADSFQKARIPMISGSATNPTLTSVGNYIFRTIASDNLGTNVLAHYLAQKRQMPNLAIIHTAEDLFSETLAQNLASTYKELGGEVLTNIGIPEGTNDLRSYLEELAPFAPAAIFITIYAFNEFASTITQLRKDQRYQNSLIIGTEGIQLFELAGDMTEDLIVAASPKNVSYQGRYFEALYKVSFGMEPDIFTSYYYDGTTILLHAMRTVYQRQQKITPEALRQEIHNTSYTGTTGTIEFDKNGDPQRRIAINQVRAGKFEKLETYVFADGSLLRVWD